MNEYLDIQDNDSEQDDWRSLDLSQDNSYQLAYRIVTDQYLADTNLPKWSGVAREFKPYNNHTAGKNQFLGFINAVKTQYVPDKLRDPNKLLSADFEIKNVMFEYVPLYDFLIQYLESSNTPDELQTHIRFYLGAIFVELNRVVEYTLDYIKQNNTFDHILISRSFLDNLVGTIDLTREQKELSPQKKRQILLSQRVYSEYTDSSRNGLDGESSTCGAPNSQVEIFVTTIVQSICYYYPLIQKRYLDIQEKA
jgi:hypothetical protein